MLRRRILVMVEPQHDCAFFPGPLPPPLSRPGLLCPCRGRVLRDSTNPLRRGPSRPGVRVVEVGRAKSPLRYLTGEDQEGLEAPPEHKSGATVTDSCGVRVGLISAASGAVGSSSHTPALVPGTRGAASGPRPHCPAHRNAEEPRVGVHAVVGQPKHSQADTLSPLAPDVP